MIRVLLVEVSRVQRELLTFILEDEPDFTLAGVAVDGEEAVEKARTLHPDIILMDFHLPKLNGIEATDRIMRECPTPIVIATASLQLNDVALSFDAVKAGALAVIRKPAGPADPHFEAEAKRIVTTLRLMSEVRVVGRRITQFSPGIRKSAVSEAVPSQKIGLVAIAGSTGAPAVIADILAAIAPNLTVPLLVVQHISEGFAAGFAEWLGHRTGLPVQLAVHGIAAAPGSVYMAPDNFHLGIDPYGRIQLDRGEPENGFRPSASCLFRSVARAYRQNALGILLTGMGRDGAAGLLEMREAGAITAVQDEASCVVFGMPGEACRLGAAAHVLPPPDLAGLINARLAMQEARSDKVAVP